MSVASAIKCIHRTCHQSAGHLSTPEKTSEDLFVWWRAPEILVESTTKDVLLSGGSERDVLLLELLVPLISN